TRYSRDLSTVVCSSDLEAQYLFARYVFDELGYRRYEWKCHNDNAPSKRAAERFGFKFEGIFRQHMVAKGGNRDTAWYAIIDKERSEERRIGQGCSKRLL